MRPGVKAPAATVPFLRGAELAGGHIKTLRQHCPEKGWEQKSLPQGPSVPWMEAHTL